MEYRGIDKFEAHKLQAQTLHSSRLSTTITNTKALISISSQSFFIRQPDDHVYRVVYREFKSTVLSTT